MTAAQYRLRHASRTFQVEPVFKRTRKSTGNFSRQWNGLSLRVVSTDWLVEWKKKLTVLPVVEQNLNDYLFIRYIVCTFYYFRHLIFFAWGSPFSIGTTQAYTNITNTREKSLKIYQSCIWCVILPVIFRSYAP